MSKWENFKDFIVGLRAVTVFLICAVFIIAVILFCEIMFALLSPIAIILLIVALIILVVILLIIASYVAIQAIGANIRRRKSQVK